MRCRKEEARILRSDNAIELANQARKDFCVEKAIRQNFNVLEIPQQNRVAEQNIAQREVQ